MSRYWAQPIKQISCIDYLMHTYLRLVGLATVRGVWQVADCGDIGSGLPFPGIGFGSTISLPSSTLWR